MSTKPSSHSRLKAILPWIVLVVVCFLLFFYRLGGYPLFDVDEPRYAEAGREMIELQNWITPYFNYELRFDKPVFFYWLVALAYKLFGVSEFSARFFSAFSATSMVFALFAFCRYYLSERLGLYSALILATSLQFIGLSRMSITDMTLCLLMGLTSLTLFLAIQRSSKWWLAAGLFSGLAVLTKGPVGLAVPGAIALFYALLTRQWRSGFLNRYLPLGLAICLAVSLPWYILAYLQNGPPFLDALLFHNVTRFSDVVTGHYQPWFFFFIVIAAGFLPWSVFLPASILYWLKTAPKILKNPPLSPSRGEFSLLEVGLAHCQLLLYSGIWVVFTFLFFTMAHTKLLTYILPLFPGLALWMGVTWLKAEEPGEEKLRRHLFISAGILALIILTAGIVFILNPALFLPREMKGISADFMTQLPVLILIFGSVVTTVLLKREKIQPALTALTASIVLLGVIALNGIVPKANTASQGPLLVFLKETQGYPLLTYEIVKPSLTFYTRHKIPHLQKEDGAKLTTFLSEFKKKVYIITKPQFARSLEQLKPPNSRLIPVHQVGRFVLFRLENRS